MLHHNCEHLFVKRAIALQHMDVVDDCLGGLANIVTVSLFISWLLPHFHPLCSAATFECKRKSSLWLSIRSFSLHLEDWWCIDSECPWLSCWSHDRWGGLQFGTWSLCWDLNHQPLPGLPQSTCWLVFWVVGWSIDRWKNLQESFQDGVTLIIYGATAKIEALCATNWSPMWIVPASNFQHAS